VFDCEVTPVSELEPDPVVPAQDEGKSSSLALPLTVLLLLAIAGGAYLLYAWDSRPQIGDVQVRLKPLAPHPLEDGLFVYELRIEAVAPEDLGSMSWIDLGNSFTFRSRRGGEWSEHQSVTRDAVVVRITDGYAKRLDEKISMTQREDKWGNGVERFSGAGPCNMRLFAPLGAQGLHWETAFQVGASPPDQLEVRGRLGSSTFVRVIDVPAQKTTATPIWSRHPDDR